MSAAEAPDRRLRMANRPLVQTLAAAVGLSCALLPQIAPLDLVARAALLGVFGGLGLLVASVARGRWTRLEIADRIHWRRPGVVLELDRTAARRVLILRSNRPIQRPTDYALEVEVGGRVIALLFSEHWLWGGRARSRAERVAEALGVPLYDDAERKLQLFRWSPLHRLVYAGHEWAILLLVVVLLGGFVLFT